MYNLLHLYVKSNADDQIIHSVCRNFKQISVSQILREILEVQEVQFFCNLGDTEF